MTPNPISSITINIILQYILPPSQLSQPLPTHLTSTSLLKRHHFLQIEPNDPLEYLCWPSPNRERSIELLENLSTRSDDEGKEVYDVRYTSDVEFTYAHVRLEEQLRIMFQWDAEDGWKYHDANLMPFPSGSRESLQHVLADAVAKASQVENPPPRVSLGADGASENGDDEYWNAYGAQGDDGDHPQLEIQPATAESGEDAYWAQYSSVQGSGDSTVPSPLPNDRRQLHHPPHLRSQQPTTPPTPDYDQNQNPLPIPNPLPRVQDKDDKLQPPSPITLTERLRSIMPRENGSRNIRPSSLGPGSPSELSVVSEHKTDEGAESGSRTTAVSPLCPLQELNAISSPNSHSKDIQDNEQAYTLRESIRSVYRLWKMSRRTDDGEDDREEFLRVAREAVGLP